MSGSILSDMFHPLIGVRQRCPLSPILFNLYLEEVMTEALSDFKGTVSIERKRINNLCFADDIDLLAKSNTD